MSEHKTRYPSNRDTYAARAEWVRRIPSGIAEKWAFSIKGRLFSDALPSLKAWGAECKARGIAGPQLVPNMLWGLTRYACAVPFWEGLSHKRHAVLVQAVREGLQQVVQTPSVARTVTDMDRELVVETAVDTLGLLAVWRSLNEAQRAQVASSMQTMMAPSDHAVSPPESAAVHRHASVLLHLEGTPWPLRDILLRLVEAVRHLMSKHDCDHLGYETWLAACDGAERAIELLERASASASAPPAEADGKTMTDIERAERDVEDARERAYAAQSLVNAKIAHLDALKLEERRRNPPGPCNCCSRMNEYNGFGSDGPTSFDCPKHCPCHD